MLFIFTLKVKLEIDCKLNSHGMEDRVHGLTVKQNCKGFPPGFPLLLEGLVIYSTNMAVATIHNEYQILRLKFKFYKVKSSTQIYTAIFC